MDMKKPEFNDRFAKEKIRAQKTFDGKTVEILYGAKDENGNSVEAREGVADGHGRWFGIEVNGDYTMFVWEHSAEEGGQTEYGTEYKEDALNVLRNAIEAKRELCRKMEEASRGVDGDEEVLAKLKEEWDGQPCFNTAKETELKERFDSAVAEFAPRLEQRKAVAAKKEEIYAKTAQLYTNDYRPLNNQAVMAFNRGDEAKAKELLAQAITKSNNAAEANATLGLIALKNGNVAEAENLIAKAADANALNEALGNLSIAKGNYAQAEEYFKDSYNNSAALAQLLNKNYAAAKATLNNIKNPNGLTSYLHAIVSARQGNKYAANSYLKEALQKDPSLKAYAENDLEFANMK